MESVKNDHPSHYKGANIRYEHIHGSTEGTGDAWDATTKFDLPD